MTDPYEIIDKYYPALSRLRDIYLAHCTAVADEACDINGRCALGLDEKFLRGAAMLHDIGIVGTWAPSIECRGGKPYICHGLIGGRMLRECGAPEEWARVAERHTGSGLTAAEISEGGLPLPAVDLLPESLLEKLVCYADKFYSKSGDMKRKTPERVMAEMKRFGAASVQRFEELQAIFS